MRIIYFTDIYVCYRFFYNILMRKQYMISLIQCIIHVILISIWLVGGFLFMAKAPEKTYCSREKNNNNNKKLKLNHFEYYNLEFKRNKYYFVSSNLPLITNAPNSHENSIFAQISLKFPKHIWLIYIFKISVYESTQKSICKL